jgi:hypothetical protein
MTFLDCSLHLEALATINAVHTDRQIEAVRGERGGWLVGADLLADCGEGGYWLDYGEWLRSLPPTDELPALVAYPSPF